MGPTYFDTVRCDNCKRNCSFRLTTFESPESDPKWKVEAGPPQAFSCPGCKHVYMIQSLEPGVVEVNLEQAGHREKLPVVFSVLLKCDSLDCESPLTVLAPRMFDTTEEAIGKELPTWTLHDLRCPQGHTISETKFY